MNKVYGVMYSKFKNSDSHASILFGNKRGVVVIDKPLSSVTTTANTATTTVTVADSNTIADELFIWGFAFRKKA